MAAWKYEISLLMLKTWVSTANKWNIFQHEKRNFVSLCGHVMSSMYVMLCCSVTKQGALVSDKEKGGTITVGDFINGATKGIGLILYYVKKVICFTFCTFWFFWCQACTGILGSLSTVVPQDFMLKHRRSKKCNPHISINQFRNKRETWAELTFAKTPATVTGDRENIGQ